MRRHTSKLQSRFLYAQSLFRNISVSFFCNLLADNLLRMWNQPKIFIIKFDPREIGKYNNSSCQQKSVIALSLGNRSAVYVSYLHRMDQMYSIIQLIVI